MAEQARYIPPWKRAAAAAAASDEPVRGPESMPATSILTLAILSKRYGFPQTGTLTPFGLPPVENESAKRSEGASWGRGVDETADAAAGTPEEAVTTETTEAAVSRRTEEAEHAAVAQEVKAEESSPAQSTSEQEDDDEQATEIPLPGQEGAELGPQAVVEPIAKLSVVDASPAEEHDPSFTTVPARRRTGPAHHPHSSKIAYITLFNSQPQFPKELWCHSNSELLTDPKGKHENWGKLVPIYKSLGKVHGFKFDGWWRIKSAKAVVPGSEELIKMLETKEALKNYSAKGRDADAWKVSLGQQWIKVYGAKLSINDVLRLKLKDPLQIDGSSEQVQQYLLSVRDTQ